MSSGEEKEPFGGSKQGKGKRKMPTPRERKRMCTPKDKELRKTDQSLKELEEEPVLKDSELKQSSKKQRKKRNFKETKVKISEDLEMELKEGQPLVTTFEGSRATVEEENKLITEEQVQSNLMEGQAKEQSNLEQTPAGQLAEGNVQAPIESTNQNSGEDGQDSAESTQDIEEDNQDSEESEDDHAERDLFKLGGMIIQEGGSSDEDQEVSGDEDVQEEGEQYYQESYESDQEDVVTYENEEDYYNDAFKNPYKTIEEQLQKRRAELILRGANPDDELIPGERELYEEAERFGPQYEEFLENLKKRKESELNQGKELPFEGEGGGEQCEGGGQGQQFEVDGEQYDGANAREEEVAESYKEEEVKVVPSEEGVVDFLSEHVEYDYSTTEDETGQSMAVDEEDNTIFVDELCDEQDDGARVKSYYYTLDEHNNVMYFAEYEDGSTARLSGFPSALEQLRHQKHKASRGKKMHKEEKLWGEIEQDPDTDCQKICEVENDELLKLVYNRYDEMSPEIEPQEIFIPPQKKERIPYNTEVPDKISLHTLQMQRFIQDMREAIEEVQETGLDEGKTLPPPPEIPPLDEDCILLQRYPGDVTGRNYEESDFVRGIGFPPPDIQDIELIRLMIRNTLITIFGAAGFRYGKQSAIDFIIDAFQDYLSHLCKAMNNYNLLQALQRGDNFTDTLSATFEQAANYDMATLHDFYQENVVERHYAVLKQCKILLDEYKELRGPEPVVEETITIDTMKDPGEIQFPDAEETEDSQTSCGSIQFEESEYDPEGCSSLRNDAEDWVPLNIEHSDGSLIDSAAFEDKQVPLGPFHG